VYAYTDDAKRLKQIHKLKSNKMSSKARFERALVLQKKQGLLNRYYKKETGEKTNLLINNNLNNK
tara:strand:- start:183 stop:377 length:195 start_codon:yes stop_codon:yes gene_type:complete